MFTGKSVSIVIPVHNEKEVIEEVVRSIYGNVYSKLDDAEFIVAEDGSTDGTKGVLEKLAKEIPIKLVISNERKGYDKAVRDALSLATKDIVFFADSDGQHKYSDFWKLLPFIEDFDIVTGFKCPRIDTWLRTFISRVMNTLIYFMFGCFSRDINSGFKVFRRSALGEVLKRCDDDLEFISTKLLIKAYLLGMQIAEVPVLHFERKFGESRGLPTSKIPIKILRLLRGLIKIKLRWLIYRRI